MINSNINSFEFKAIPTFGILNYKTAISFYVGFLGFKIDWEYRPTPTGLVYMQVSNNGLVLHLSEGKRFDAIATVFIETSNIKEFRKKLKIRNPDCNIQNIELTNRETMQLEIVDPFGNLLRFNESVIEKYDGDFQLVDRYQRKKNS